MIISRRIGLALILMSGAVSLVWGFYLAQTGSRWVDFRAVYYGARCLMEHRDPYKVSDLEDVYRAEKGAPPDETPIAHQGVTLYVNLPTTLLLVAPFAALPWGPAHLLWIASTAGFLFLAAVLMWDVGARHAPIVSLVLVCIVLADCESIFLTGNAGGIVVGLCAIAVWCFVEQRFVWAGVICLALSLAIKPHDGGLVWLYFVLAGAPYRKRALQSFLITSVLGIAALLWVSAVAPHWMEDWRANLTTISQPGGINEPGPNALTGRSSSMVVDIQAAVSIFRDDPHVYNPASYLVCGVLLLLWAARALKQRGSPSHLETWLALASITAITMLVTYHRPWDAKLLMLSIPGCAMLWARGGRVGRIAVLVTGAATVLTADVPLVALVGIANKVHANTSSLGEKMLTLMLTRPASLALLGVAIFYLWVFLRTAGAKEIPAEIVEV